MLVLSTFIFRRDSGDNLTDCPCKGVLFDKEYQAILAGISQTALTFRNRLGFVKKLLGPLSSYILAEWNFLVFLFINHISSSHKYCNKSKSTFLPSL